MSSWTFVPLERLAAKEKSAISKPYGSAMLKQDYRVSGVPVVRGVNLARGRFYDDGFVYIDPEHARRIPGAILKAGDLVITHRGTVGQVSMIPRKPRYCEYVASTSHVKVRLDDQIAVPEFYYYWFSSALGRRSILDNVSTVGVPGLAQPVATVKRLMVPHPPLPEQRAIAEVLGALDDKIAANASLVQSVDELMRVTFQSLLYDGERIPLSSLARFINGKAFTKGATGTGRVVIRIAELNSGIGGSTVYNDLEVADDHLARPGDLLFAWSGSLTVHRWFRPEGIVNQHIFKVVPEAVPMWVMKSALDQKLTDFKAIAADKATTMGHIQRRHLDEPVLVPSAGAIKEHDASMSALWQRALLAEQESLHLAELRDALLPGLMSGKIRVKDGERVVGEAV